MHVLRNRKTTIIFGQKQSSFFLSPCGYFFDTGGREKNMVTFVILNNEKNILKPEKKIGEGHFRECFAVEGEPGLCIKKLKPTLSFWQRLQLFLLRRNINREEYNVYYRLPSELKPYFNPAVSISSDSLIVVRPMDYDGSHSRPVSDYGKVSNRIFWEEVEHIVSLFEKHNFWFLDAFQLGTNVFVQRLSEEQWRPVIIDYKRQGWRSYPMQLNLLMHSEKRKKFYRKYRRFLTLFKDNPAK